MERGMVEAAPPLYGDVLGCILSHVPTVDLLAARHVSRTWHSVALSSSRLSPRLKPWLILRLPRASVAYDPHSRSWVPLPPPDPTPRQQPVRSSHPQLLFRLAPGLSLLQPLSATWTSLPSPRDWRVDPVVALVGNTVVVAGGTSEYDVADLRAVETVDPFSPDPLWAPRVPIPPELDSSATWLSVATSEDRLHLLSKNTGTFSSFDPRSGTWSPPHDLRPHPDIGLSAIAFSGSRLLYAGLAKSTLRVWEVNSRFRCGEEIGRMPAEMTTRLLGEGLGRMTSIGFAAVGEFAYFYNPNRFREGFFYDMADRRWESIGRPKAVNDDPTARIVFGCSIVTLDQLLKLFRSCPEVQG